MRDGSSSSRPGRRRARASSGSCSTALGTRRRVVTHGRPTATQPPRAVEPGRASCATPRPATSCGSTVNQWRQGGARTTSTCRPGACASGSATSVWDRYFTFCFERDPWDKLVSFYWWRTREDRTTRPTSRPSCARRPDLSAWPPVHDRRRGRGRLRRALREPRGRPAPGARPHRHRRARSSSERQKGGFRQDELEFSPELDGWVVAELPPRDRPLRLPRPARSPDDPDRRTACGGQAGRDVDDDLADVLVGLHGAVGVGDVGRAGTGGR